MVYFILADTHPNLELRENGLLYSEGREKPSLDELHSRRTSGGSTHWLYRGIQCLVV